MWHGVYEYLLFVAIVAFALPALSRRYLFCKLAGAPLCSALNLIHKSWLANWQVNLAWAPPMFLIGCLFALPVCVVAGLPWLIVMRGRTRG